MHELSVTENIIAIAERHARAAQATRIVSIRLVIGELSSIVDDSIQFYFDHLAANTLAAGATLVFDRRPVSLCCAACGHTWQPEAADWTCPLCGQARAQITAGREFYIDSIEVE
ncbi:MAG: hydrogenase maturation nickel metallochaperone HypA [Chloroflexi bacterium]|nr:hydrogenase maturation nickel metallochaperone HypA [Chloroflexota bacterium]